MQREGGVSAKGGGRDKRVMGGRTNIYPIVNINSWRRMVSETTSLCTVVIRYPITILNHTCICNSMTTVTLKAKGLQNEILERMVSLGLASTKKEAVEFALLKTAFDIGLLKSEEILKCVDKLIEQKRLSPEEVAAEIESVKNESVY